MSRPRRRRWRRLQTGAPVLVLAAVVAAACSTSIDDIERLGFQSVETVDTMPESVPSSTVEPAETTPPATPPGTPSAEEDEPELPSPADAAIMPLTGLPVGEVRQARPALAVRIDNAVEALPQRGLEDADIVVENLVETGITRLFAVYHTTVPPSVGPVRSARSTDVDLLAPFSSPGFVYWSSNAGVARELEAARTAGGFVDLGIDIVPSAYYREDLPGRALEQTGYVRLPEIAAAVVGGVPPTPLFSYGAQRPAGATPAAGVVIDWPAGQRASFVWDEVTATWLRSQWGGPHLDEDGRVLRAANVIVMVTSYGVSAADPRSPQAVSVGNGLALVFSGGAVVEGTWERTDPTSPWQILDDQGQPIPLTPGVTWIELVPADLTTVLGPAEALPLLEQAGPLT